MPQNTKTINNTCIYNMKDGFSRASFSIYSQLEWLSKPDECIKAGMRRSVNRGLYRYERTTKSIKTLKIVIINLKAYIK